MKDIFYIIDFAGRSGDTIKLSDIARKEFFDTKDKALFHCNKMNDILRLEPGPVEKLFTVYEVDSELAINIIRETQ